MKRISIILIAILAIVMASCSQGSPKGAVKKYMNALEDEEFYEAAKYCVECVNQDNKMTAANKANKLRTDHIKKYKLLGVEEIDERQAVAAVKVTYYHQEGETLQNIYLTKVNDKWYVGKASNDQVNQYLKSDKDAGSNDGGSSYGGGSYDGGSEDTDMGGYDFED